MEKFATITVTSSYAGDALKQYILQALIGGETLSTTGIQVLTNVKYKRIIKKLASSGVVQTNTCEFTPTSGVTITESKVEPKAFMVNESICFEDIWNLWDSADMAAGMHAEKLPQELVNGVTEEYVGQVAVEVEEAIWQGNATGSTSTIKDLFDGYEYILDNGHGSCTALDVTAAVASAFTVTSIVTELNRLYASLPAAILKKPKGELVIFLSHYALSLYEMNLATQGVRTSIEGGVPTLYGIELKAVGGLSDNRFMAMGEKKNFYIATDLESDLNQIKLLDQRDVDGSEKVNFVLRAKIDVAIAYPCEVVWYN
jgi:hypothetical protein